MRGLPLMELIDLRQLRAFGALAETKSFTGAAQKLFLTQSAVSHSIKALETALDCRLFDRAGKSVALTQQGRILLARSGRIFREMQAAWDEISESGSWGAGTVRLGATMTMCQYLIPAVLREFQLSFPRCEIRIEPGDTEAILRRLEDGEIDLVVGLQIPKATRFSYRKLFEDELALVVSPSHPWATQARLSPEDIEGQRFIVYGRNSFTYRLVERTFDREGVTLTSPLELGSMEAIKELAKIGFGVGVVAPWVASEEIAQQTLVYRMLKNQRLSREWGIYFNRGRSLSLAEETFAGICELVAGTFVPNRQLEMGRT
ncbi:LysR family transcriptional regulator [soil metagenome]